MHLDKFFLFFYSGCSSEVSCLPIDGCRNSEERIFFNNDITAITTLIPSIILESLVRRILSAGLKTSNILNINSAVSSILSIDIY